MPKKKSKKSYIYQAAVVVLVLYAAFHTARIGDAVLEAKNAVPNHAVATIGEGEEEIRYIAAGDSVPAGLGTTDSSYGYPYRIASALANGGKTVVYANVAESGFETHDVIGRLDEIAAFDPDIVTVSVGGNDLIRVRPNREIVKNFRMIATRLEAETDAQIYMANMPSFREADLLPLPYRFLIEEKVKDINAELWALDGGRVHVLDAHDAWRGRVPDAESVLSGDRFHPNNLGHQIWANEFLRAMGEEPFSYTRIEEL